MRLADHIALSRPMLAFGTARCAAGRAIARRRNRPLVAMIAVPLALIATALTDLWWAWLPLSALAWWFADRDIPWLWFLAIGFGVFGTTWAYCGAVALATYPDSRLLVVSAWIAYPVINVSAGLLMIHFNDPDPPPSRCAASRIAPYSDDE